MIRLTRFLVSVSFVLVLLFLFSCAPGRSNTEYKESVREFDVKKQYDVVGVGEEYFEARNKAIADGFSKASIDIIGKKKFESNKELIFREAINRKVIKGLVEFHSTKIYSVEGKKAVEGYVIVDMGGLKKFLDSLPLSEEGKELVPSKGLEEKKAGPVEVKVDKVSKVGGEEEAKEFKLKESSPVKDMVFLVLPPSDKLKSLQGDEDLKMFIEIVNSELSRLGLSYIDLNRAMNLSKKFSLIYEERTGEAMSIAQLVAQEVKAPVYLEVDISFILKFVSGNYVELVTSGTVKAYDSSTGKGLGVVPFSRELKSNKGLYQTKIEVMRMASKVSVGRILETIENYFSSGVSISVKVVGFKKISDEKDFSTFLDSLPGINSKKRKSISGNVAEYEVNYKGGVSAFVDDLIDLASSHPKYSNISVDQSGNLVIITLR